MDLHNDEAIASTLILERIYRGQIEQLITCAQSFFLKTNNLAVHSHSTHACLLAKVSLTALAESNLHDTTEQAKWVQLMIAYTCFADASTLRRCHIQSGAYKTDLPHRGLSPIEA